MLNCICRTQADKKTFFKFRQNLTSKIKAYVEGKKSTTYYIK